jgi:hypothetical protein
MSDARVIHPHNYGWLEKKLSTQEMDYLWKCVDNKKESHKHLLAGNIHESNTLIDENDWFYENTLLPLIHQYGDVMGNVGGSVPVNQYHPYSLQQMWVNYQKQNEFNPLHDHGGVYSFVVWMKIPTRHFEQNKNPIALRSNHPKISTFEFRYTDTLGKISEFVYEMNPEMEGTMLFFPSKLMHQVNPFFNCDEDRISISGNIVLNTKEVI